MALIFQKHNSIKAYIQNLKRPFEVFFYKRRLEFAIIFSVFNLSLYCINKKTVGRDVEHRQRNFI